MLDLLFPEAVFEHDTATDGPGRETQPRPADLLVFDPQTNYLGIVRDGARCWFRSAADTTRLDAWRVEDTVPDPDALALRIARRYRLDAVPQSAHGTGEYVWKLVANRT